MATISHLRSWYRKFYVAISGSGAQVKPWHFQYASTFYLHRTLRRLLPYYGGDILDVGCGNKPYQDWFGHIRTYVGLDIYPGEKVDVVVQPTERWPFPDSSFDVVICTQVLEHVESLQHTLNEIMRVLRPGGVLIASFPFIYNEHGEPNDFRRFSAYGARQLFSEWDIQLVERQGGIGTTLALLLLNWIDAQLSLSDKVRWLKGVLLPLWLPFCLLCNGVALLVDRIDLTGKFYSNVLVVCLKK
ncbi:MAG: class I SAM-dependent methyltransferase [Armatimonadota bacterium]